MSKTWKLKLAFSAACVTIAAIGLIFALDSSPGGVGITTALSVFPPLLFLGLIHSYRGTLTVGSLLIAGTGISWLGVALTRHEFRLFYVYFAVVVMVFLTLAGFAVERFRDSRMSPGRQ